MEEAEDLSALRVGLTFRYPAKAEPYRKALRLAGLEPVDLTPDHSGVSLDGLSGLVLSGGSDVDPSWYSQANIAAKSPDPARDEMELGLVAAAIAAGMPLLAICRGMQLLNVQRGGTLHQDIGEAHAGAPHGVETVAGSLLREIVEHRCEVNSRHHQAVDRVGADLIVTARAADGVIEGLELPGAPFVVAVQWHPEDLATPGTPHLRLFQSLASAVLHWKR
ncbi:MAG: type 1 glutamine amidotransferase [Acidobacteria bacterium]|nr:type 1 glutamine amidotransferase [Acidobacteriota bacterium]